MSLKIRPISIKETLISEFHNFMSAKFTEAETATQFENEIFAVQDPKLFYYEISLELTSSQCTMRMHRSLKK